MTDLTVEARVAQGVAWLDTNYCGWERVIDLATLDLKDTTACVLGQIGAHIGISMGCRVVEGELVDADDWRQSGFATLLMMHRPFLDSVVAQAHLGFTTGTRDEYADLDAAWTSLIKERFGSGTLSDEVVA